MPLLTLSTDSLQGYGINRIFELVKEAGYDGVDLAIDSKNFDTQNVEYLKHLMEEYDLPIVSLQTPMNANPKTILKAVDMAKELGVKIIIVQPPRLFNLRYIKWLVAEVPKIRQKEDLSIALENAPSDTFFGIIPEHAMQSITDLKKFKHAALDTTRVAYKKDDLIRVYNILKKFLVHIHLSNVRKGKGYALPDEGVLPLESFLTKLRQDGYKGAVSFKIHPKHMQAGDDAKVKKHLTECKKYYETYFVKVAVTPEKNES